MKDTPGTVFAIKRFAIHDGPHIRTTVFLKGCPLSCWWCHNPEGIDAHVKMISVDGKCLHCGDCVDHCPQGALSEQQGHILRSENDCAVCGTCEDVCPNLGHAAVGWTARADEIMHEILKDQAFFLESGGGVTFSGGEPLMQADFLLSLLSLCRQSDIHTAVDTTAYASRNTIARLSREADLFLVDLKHMDSTVHKQHTGVGNELILENIQFLAQAGVALRIRIPLIPGFNDTSSNLRQSAQFVSGLKGTPPIDLLPYHDTAISKYSRLKLDYSGPAASETDLSDPNMAADFIRSMGPIVHLGG